MRCGATSPLNGGANNSAIVTYHDENTLPAFDYELPFNGGFEGAMDLDPKRFATLTITDAATNAAGHPVGYELQPFKNGWAQPYGAVNTSQANDPYFLHKGLTLIHWSGFDLVPHDFFDANPLGAPYRHDCDGGP